MIHTPSLRAAAFTALALLANACRPSPQEYAAIDAWLLCDECVDGERAAVRAIGGKVVHTLDQALVGPSPGRVANKEAQFQQMWRTLASPASSESAYVAELLSNYVARYQQRAAISLGDIGGSRAVAALTRARDSAATRGYRPDVVAVIQAVLGLKQSAPFGGTVTPRTPPFGGVVVVAEGSGPAWDGDEAVTLHGSPFADSLVVARWPDSLALVAAGKLGDYALSVSGLGSRGGVTQVSSLQIVPPGYVSHSPTTAPFLTADSLPQTRYLLLPGRVGDTTDFFRVEAGAGLMVTASVTSAGLTAPAIRWYLCIPVMLVPVGAAVTALSGYVIDEAGRPVGNAHVAITGTGFAAVTDGSGMFSFASVFSSPVVVQVRAHKIGYAPSVTGVQLGADTIRISLVAAGATEATARSRSASTVTIPSGACRFLQVTVPGAGGSRVVRLGLTSP